MSRHLGNVRDGAGFIFLVCFLIYLLNQMAGSWPMAVLVLKGYFGILAMVNILCLCIQYEGSLEVISPANAN
jgi:hypothetical protein